MVQDGSYCIDILTQISAVRSALDQVAANLATDHVRHCILEEKSGKEMTQEELLEELRTTLSRLMR